MKKAILIQARLSSSRFPKKMLNLISGIPLVEYVFKRCSISSKADIVSVITSDDKSDDELFDYCVSRKIQVYRGTLYNVLNRYIKAAEFYNSDIICRVSGDSPFVDVELIDRMFQIIENEKLDYLAPDKSKCIAGLDSEVITLNALKKSINISLSDYELEHVTVYI